VKTRVGRTGILRIRNLGVTPFLHRQCEFRPEDHSRYCVVAQHFRWDQQPKSMRCPVGPTKSQWWKAGPVVAEARLAPPDSWKPNPTWCLSPVSQCTQLVSVLHSPNILCSSSLLAIWHTDHVPLARAALYRSIFHAQTLTPLSCKSSRHLKLIFWSSRTTGLPATVNIPCTSWAATCNLA